MKFRPCIDLHNGKVKQIVGSTLSDDSPESLETNFTSEFSSSYYAQMYRRDNLYGGHVIMLGPGNESAAREAFQAFPQARHSSRLYCLDAEEQLLDMQRVYDYLQSGRWFRQVSSVGTFSLGGHIYNATTHFADQALEITFNGSTCKLTCLPEKETATFQLGIQGLTKAALMGNPLALPSYTAYQLALPLVYPDTTL